MSYITSGFGYVEFTGKLNNVTRDEVLGYLARYECFFDVELDDESGKTRIEMSYYSHNYDEDWDEITDDIDEIVNADGMEIKSAKFEMYNEYHDEWKLKYKHGIWEEIC